VCVISRRKPYAYVQEVSVENGPEEAWCVSTEHGTIISRDGDCVTISGNCEAMFLMMQRPEPDDFVIATGETHTVRQLVECAFGYAGLDWRRYVRLDPEYLRPTEVDNLRGDAAKAKRLLGWEPRTRFDGLVRLMVDGDAQLLREELEGVEARLSRET
jgi:GDP-D-mannose dehydratase